MYICPKCSRTLERSGSAYKCEQGHSYDIAAKGYVNLLQSNKRSGHGDSKEMLLARRQFLNSGHYFPIITKLTEHICSLGKDELTVLDAGCGEGYYTSELYKNLSQKHKSIIFYGIDVSKDAVSLAAKDKSVSFSVASINSLPFPSEAFDVIFSLFAPLNEEEFTRVLKPGGALVTVSPSENHLFGLKQMIYKTQYKNPPSTFANNVLKKTNEEIIEYKISLKNQVEISNLFKMTPYYHKSSREDVAKALSITELETEIGFNIITYQKI